MTRKLPAACRRQSCPIFEGQTSEPELPVWNLTSGAHMAAGRQTEEGRRDTYRLRIPGAPSCVATSPPSHVGLG